jgi:hypothetical protein
MDEADSRTLAAIVEQTRNQKVRVDHTACAQLLHHIQTMPSIRDVHPIEEGKLSRRQPAGQLFTFLGGDAGTEVRPGPLDFRGPPSRHQLNRPGRRSGS